MTILYCTVSPGVLVSLSSPAGLGEQLEKTVLHWNKTQLVQLSHRAKTDIWATATFVEPMCRPTLRKLLSKTAQKVDILLE